METLTTDKKMDTADFEPLEKLGAGAFGDVWLVFDQKRKEKVALKYLHLEQTQQEYVELFKQEFALLSELRHAHLAQVFDFGFSPKENQYYFTSEFCPGVNLTAAVKDKSISYFEEVLVQILTALDYVHANGVVHLDIKSDNILVAAEGEHPHVRILDFGVASKLKNLPQGMVGTLAYMAPEMITQSTRVDHRADLYSLGMVCLRALTGSFPFDVSDRDVVMNWQLHGTIPEEIWQKNDIPSYLRDIIEKLLAKNPSDRFSNARVVLRFLNVATGSRYRKAEEELMGKLPAEGPLVGRDELLQELNRRMDDSLQREKAVPGSSVLFLSGEQGVGKSRIVDEMKRRIELNEVKFFHVVCDWQIAAWPRLAAWLNLGSLAGDDLNAEWQSRRRVDALLEAAKEGAICLLIDDFHKADRDLVLFIESLNERSQKERQDSHAISVFALVAGEKEHEGGIPLSRVKAEDVARYASQVLGPVDRVDSAASVLWQYSGGLPLLMVEGLKFMAPHLYRGEPLENLMPPPEIGSLYAARVEALSPEEKEFLWIVALLFRPARSVELAQILEVTPADLVRVATGGLREGLIFKSEASGEEATYQTSSQALALDLINSLPPDKRKVLHLKVALGLEKIPDISKEELAFHMARGGEAEKGRQYYREAGLSLKLAGQVASAVRSFNRAVELASEGAPEWQELMEEAIRLLVLCGSYQEAKKQIEKLDKFPSAVREELKGWLSFKLRQFSQAREAYQEALNLLPNDNPLKRILLENALANVDLQDGRINPAGRRFRTTLELESTLTPEDLRQINNNNLGFVLSLEGDSEKAIEFYQNRLKRLPVEQTTDRLSLLNGLGYVLIQSSRFEEAITALTEARELAEKTGAMHSLFSIMGNLITALQKEARYAEALPLLKRIIQYQERLGNERDVAYNLLREGSTYLTLGMGEAAQECFEKGRELAKKIDSKNLATWFVLMQGYWQREFGVFTEAEKIFHQTLKEAEIIPDDDLIAWARYSLADLYFEQGKKEECQKELQRISVLPSDDEFKARLDLLKGKLMKPGPENGELVGYFTDLEERCLKNHYQEILWELYDAWGRAHIYRGRRMRACELFEKGAKVIEGVAATVPEEYRDRYLKQRQRKRLFDDWRELKAARVTQAQPQETVHAPDWAPDKAGAGAGAAVDTEAARGPAVGLKSSEILESLNKLLAINRRMVSEREPQHLLEYIMDEAIELSGTEEGLLLLADDDGENLEIGIARNLNKNDAEHFHFSQSIAEQVFQTGESLFSLNAMEDSKLGAFESVATRGLRTVICLPLKILNRVLGVVYLGTKRGMPQMSKGMVNILQAFADLAALALQNALLFQSEREGKEQLSQNLSETKKIVEEQADRLSELESLASTAPRPTLYPYAEIVGSSRKMEGVLKTLDKVTNAVVPVFLHGETGTGKELLARALHFNSVRKKNHFVAINCSAFTETILESELFGYVKGAFTGADHDRKGLIQQAHQGTLFLDEVGDMSLSMQAKLLRVIQEQELIPVGGRDPIKIEVRIVSASNKDLKQMVRQETFREDLYFRLAGITVNLPPLRERREDIPLLVKHLIEKICKANGIATPPKVAREAMDRLVGSPWPGNIRELEQCLTTASLFAEGEVIGPAQLFLEEGPRSEEPKAVSASSPGAQDLGSLLTVDLEKSLEDYERDIIQKTVELCGGNKSEAARRLDVSRLTLHKKLKEKPEAA